MSVEITNGSETPMTVGIPSGPPYVASTSSLTPVSTGIRTLTVNGTDYDFDELVSDNIAMARLYAYVASEGYDARAESGVLVENVINLLRLLKQDAVHSVSVDIPVMTKELSLRSDLWKLGFEVNMLSDAAVAELHSQVSEPCEQPAVSPLDNTSTTELFAEVCRRLKLRAMDSSASVHAGHISAAVAYSVDNATAGKQHGVYQDYTLRVVTPIEED